MTEKTVTPVVGIVGLGRVGRALGLALQSVRTNYALVGHEVEDADLKAARAANAVDRFDWNLAAVAEAADVLVLTEPLERTLHTLELVAPHLREGVVVTDTVAAKVPVLARAREVLPATVSFIGGHPIVAAAGDSADLFSGVTWCVVPDLDAEDAAVSLVMRLVAAVGAEPFFIDAAEHDALFLASGPLAHVMAAAIERMAGSSASARDLWRLTPPAARAALGGGADDEAYRRLLQDNPEAVLPWLDGLLEGLREVRAALAAADSAALASFFAEVDAARGMWTEAGQRDEPERSAAFDELKDRNIMRDALFGGFGRRRT